MLQECNLRLKAANRTAKKRLLQDLLGPGLGVTAGETAVTPSSKTHKVNSPGALCYQAANVMLSCNTAPKARGSVHNATMLPQSNLDIAAPLVRGFADTEARPAQRCVFCCVG